MADVTRDFSVDSLEIIELPEPAIALRGFYVCDFKDGVGLVVQESIAQRLQQLADDYGLPVLANDMFFASKKQVDYDFFEVSELESKLASIKQRNIKKSVKRLIVEKKKALLVYSTIREGVASVKELAQSLGFRTSVVYYYLRMIEQQGFIKEVDGFYSVYPERDYVLTRL